MAEYVIVPVSPSSRANAAVDALLRQEGIRRDANLDYTCAMYDDSSVIATGSCFGNTLRCLAVRADHQGEGQLNRIISHLIQVQLARGRTHLFLCTKPQSAQLFGTLGFSEIARVEQKLVFLENRRMGFPSFLHNLEAFHRPGKNAALVMNANPFTLGHQYLAETAAARCDTLHLFIVSEEASVIPFAVRKALVKAGVAHLPNVICHDSGPYVISRATFPSYFLKDAEEVTEAHARLDLAVFCRIAEALQIEERFVGEEPFSQMTGIYNRVMQEALPRAGIACTIVPRRRADGFPISASAVRQHLKDGNMEALKSLVPKTTLDFFLSKEAKPILDQLRRTEDVVHH